MGFFLFTSCDREQEKPADEAPSTAPRWVTIGTDEATGLSHVTGLSIAKVAGKKLEAMGFRIRVKTTDGPVSSLNAVDAGDLDFAVVSSDVLYEATRGLGPWAAQGPQTDLLAVFTVHAESVSLLAAEDAGIETLEDLKGKRVNIGEPGSKERRSSAHVLENAGLDLETDIRAEEALAADAPGMLQDGRIDAFFVTTEHPNDTYQDGIRRQPKGPLRADYERTKDTPEIPLLHSDQDSRAILSRRCQSGRRRNHRVQDQPGLPPQGCPTTWSPGSSERSLTTSRV